MIFEKLSMPKELRHLEKSSNMLKIWQKREENHAQLAFCPIFG